MQSIKLFCLVLFFSFLIISRAQVPIDTSEFKGHTVTAYSNKPKAQSSLNIIQISIDSNQTFGTSTLTDVMAKTPGVQMLSTGIGISKPVVRGLTGNRLLILLSGLKFDNQQWQEEHGLGLSEIGIGSIEIIKGPMGVLYGSEAIGGIINLIDEKALPKFGSRFEFGTKAHSNTRGGNFNIGFLKSNHKNWFNIRLSVDQQADYSNGNNERVLNSRFGGYLLKAGLGFNTQKNKHSFHYTAAYNQFGFIFNDVYKYIEVDSRWKYALNINPSHMVLLNNFAYENEHLINSKWKYNFKTGLQSNSRRENEGSGAISLNMHLITYQYLLKVEHKFNKKNTLIFSHLNSIENNTNYGARKIVPDAWMHEANLSTYLESKINSKIRLENGAGIGNKTIKTLLTNSVNTGGKDIEPFLKSSPYFNVFSGLHFKHNQYLNSNFNFATGVRIPNLAELSSDGLHEGVFTFEIGNPNLKNEQNFSLNYGLNFQSENLTFGLTPFYNYFYNYVFLAPSSDQWNGFPIFKYTQRDIEQIGGEFYSVLNITKQLSWSFNASAMRSMTLLKEFTPYTPAAKIVNNMQHLLYNTSKNRIRCYAELEYYAPQNDLAPKEIGTNAYFLFNAGFSGSFINRNHEWIWSITGHNLSNTMYFNHLSRLKYFGIYNPGRNISFSLKYRLNKYLY